MKGQWFGQAADDPGTMLVIDLDDLGDRDGGTALVYKADASSPDALVHLTSPDKSTSFSGVFPVQPLHPATSEAMSREELTQHFPDAAWNDVVTANLRWTADTLEVEWDRSSGESAKAVLPRSRAGELSECKPLEIETWADFKYFVRSLAHYSFIYRGQEDSRWRLRTAFHRSGRSDLMKYLHQDIPVLYQHATAVTKHFYNLGNNVENAAFYSLMQHHGFPTPLLDWTYSPYVAAYFAFARVPKTNIPGDRKVRLFIFDKSEWMALPQLGKLAPAKPHFSLLETLAIDNIRLLPQQALSTLTNLDDIESYLLMGEELYERMFLRVVDLPATERSEVMHELGQMGLTASSLFPGLDGICQTLRERFFE